MAAMAVFKNQVEVRERGDLSGRSKPRGDPADGLAGFRIVWERERGKEKNVRSRAPIVVSFL